MKLMIASELGSRGALAMLVFHRLFEGKGTKPSRAPSRPRLRTEQGEPWAKLVKEIANRQQRRRRKG
jgi:hypothetical protein